MTLEDFRKHKFLPAQWKKELATNGILQLVLQVMEENHPARMTIRADKDDDLSPTRAAVELGVTRGYSMFADRLRLLSNFKPTPENMPETTYDPPPKPVT